MTHSEPYLERIDEEDGEIRFEIHSAHEEDGWMIVFSERNDRYAREHANMMMALLLAYWPKQFVSAETVRRALIAAELPSPEAADVREAFEAAARKLKVGPLVWESHGCYRYDDVQKAYLAFQAGASSASRGYADGIEELRAEGWSVAVHNDYRLNGERHTFWLLTHPDGRYVKGEGKTDAEAIAAIRDLAPQPRPEEKRL